jgi:hypothetical protein
MDNKSSIKFDQSTNQDFCIKTKLKLFYLMSIFFCFFLVLNKFFMNKKHLFILLIISCLIKHNVNCSKNLVENHKISKIKKHLISSNGN